jgi:hypothetical protein
MVSLIVQQDRIVRRRQIQQASSLLAGAESASQPVAADDPLTSRLARSTLVHRRSDAGRVCPDRQSTLELLQSGKYRMHVTVVQARKQSVTLQVDHLGRRVGQSPDLCRVGDCDDHALADRDRSGPALRRADVPVEED